MNAVDTNILIYAYDDDEPIKQTKALDLLAQLAANPFQTYLLWQVGCEFLNWLRKWEAAGHLSTSDTLAAFNDISDVFPLRMPNSAVLTSTFGLRSRYSLSHWDSILIAACKDAGVSTLFTEDLAAGMDYDGVKVVNPFI